MKSFFILAITAIFIIACGNPVQVPLEFETFEKTVTEVGPEGGQAGLELKVDIPPPSSTSFILKFVKK